MMMHIAFVGTKGLPYQQSQDTKEYILEPIAEELVSRGYTVSVLADPNYTQIKDYRSIHNIYTNGTDWGDIRALLTIKDLDIVHIMTIRKSWIAFWISVLRPHVRVICEYHEYTYIHKETKQMMIYNYLAYTYSHSLLVDRLSLRESLPTQYHQKVITYQPYISHHPQRNTEILEYWNIIPQEYYVLKALSHYDIKQLKLTLLGYLKSKPIYPLMIIGSVPHSIKNTIIDPNIHYIGSLNGESEREIITNARVFIDPYQDQENKIPTLIAIIHGTPVITARSWTNENITRNYGVTITPYNLQSIITAFYTIRDFYRIKLSHAKIIQNHMQDVHTVSHHTNQYIQAYIGTHLLVSEEIPSENQRRVSIPIYERV